MVWALVALGPGVASAQNERVETCPFRGTMLDFSSHQNSPWSMTPLSGRPCVVRVGAWSGVVFEGIRIVAQPRNGTVQATGRSGAIYRSRDGFRGADTFSARLCANVQGRSGCVVLDFAVDVR